MGNATSATPDGRKAKKKSRKPEIKERAASYVVPVEMAAELIVHMHLTTPQITEAKEAFAAYDKSSMGKIPTKNFIYVMRSLGQNPTEDETMEMIYEADPDNSGFVDFVDFLDKWARYTAGDLDETIKEAFSLFDKDGSGTISLEEFRKVMINEGAQMTDEEIDEIIGEADVDGDGQMNIKEFVTMLLGQG